MEKRRQAGETSGSEEGSGLVLASKELLCLREVARESAGG